MKDAGDITLYHLVVSDRITGRKRVLTDRPPIAGRYKAEAGAQEMERANRDPNLHYSVEPSQRKEAEETLVPEALLTHKFRVR